MSIYTEIWTRPGDASFGRVIDDPPWVSHSFHDGINLLGDGNGRIPKSFDRFDEILKVDHATPANCVSSLVRVFDDSDPTTPLFEWLPYSILPGQSKQDPNVDIAGRGIKSILRHARVEAFDWDGSVQWVPQFPDWIYGGDNVLQNPGFESPGTRPTIYELIITATGGTYTLTDGTDTTSNIDWNDNAITVETRLEADIAAIDDVLVTAIDGGFEIEFVSPGFGVSLSVNTGSLTGGSATMTQTQAGVLTPNPWTKSKTINLGTEIINGDYDEFEVSTAVVRTGTYSLRIDPATIGRRFAGAQQVVSVEPGGTYQASIWVYPTGASQEYRFVIREVDEDLIAFDQQTLTAGQWNQMTISDVVIPDGQTQVIFRLGNINATGNPSRFYLDDAEFNEGQAATTIGEILGELYADATSDHSGRVVWEDGTSGNPYLTLDFTDTVDSNGVAWFDTDISIKIWMRMTYLQVMEQFASTWGYEWRIVPDDVESGTWLWQVYNPGTMKTDYTSAQSPAIQGGSQDVSRTILRVLPSASQSMVEGIARATARYSEADLQSAIGRIEGSRLDRELPLLSAIQNAAYEDSLDALVSGLAYIYTLVDPPDLPFADYGIGDLLTIHDPPEVSDDARCVDVECVVNPDGTEWEVQFIPATAAGS